MLNIFFVTLGVIFFILILIAAYLFFTDIRPLMTSQEIENSGAVESVFVEDKHPALSESQEKTLETFGINPANLPTEISTEQEQCFEEKLGSLRVEEIKAGASPTPLEFIKAKDCI